MARSRWRILERFAAILVLTLTACSGGPAAGDDGGPLPGFDAPPPAGLFPLHVAGDGGSLVTDDGKPFLLHGEAAWSLIVQLNTTDTMRYLADRHARGVNVLIVELIEHYYADHPPQNAAGDAPFTKPGDFTTPNEAYFAHADVVIDLAASQGMAVLLAPSYLGYGGGAEGWYQEMTRLSPQQCLDYGNYLGRRYAGKPNIIWLWGGDYTPPPSSPPDKGETCLAKIRDGIRQGGSTALASAHWAPESTSRDETTFAGSIDLVGVYTYLFVMQACRSARTTSSFPRMPTYLIETCYEHETIRSCKATPSEVRRRQWWGFLGCGAGEIVGNNPIWKFGIGWPQELGSPVSVNEQRLFAVAQQLPWQTLELADTLVTSDRGTNYGEIAVARTSDRKHALIYIPPDGASMITVDLSQMSGPATAQWLDPTADRSTDAGSDLTGSHTFTTPGSNAGRDKDWVLALSAP